MPLSGLPIDATRGAGLSGVPRPSRRRRQLHLPPQERGSLAAIQPDIDPLELADDLDMGEIDSAGDDRSEFNLGGGGRWIRAALTDDEEWWDEE